MFRLLALAAIFFVLSCSSTPEAKTDVGISVQLELALESVKHFDSMGLTPDFYAIDALYVNSMPFINFELKLLL